jgi:hypothetical protein
MSASVALVPTDLGKNIGEQTVAACAARSLDPCTVGYLYDIKASALDVAMRDGFNEATKGAPIKIVAEGESFFTATVALGAVQDKLTAHPDIQLIVGSDQGIQGAVQALDAAGKAKDISLVGYGGSATGVAGVAAGTWFSTVLMTPASEGRLGMQALIKAIRTGEDSGAINPTEDLPEVITKDNAGEFTAEWLGLPPCRPAPPTPRSVQPWRCGGSARASTESRCCAISRSTSCRDPCTVWWVRTAPASRHSARSSPGSTAPMPAVFRWTANPWPSARPGRPARTASPPSRRN